MSNGAVLKLASPTTKAEKHTRTTLDTLELTPDVVNGWVLPPFQRELHVNPRVEELAAHIRDNEGVISGVLTLGVLGGKTYLLDGQHRRKAFILSECKVGYSDVRICYFETMAEMGEEYVRLNSSLVRMRPDDILRGLEQTSEALMHLRKRCPFVGYDHIRYGDKAPILSMSMAIRAWRGSAGEMPSSSACGISATTLVQMFTLEDARPMADFMLLALGAWGRDESYVRLWNTLNLSLCMWLYRRLVLTQHSHKVAKMAPEVFSRCLMALSANSNYLDWLAGRRLTERDRSPAYSRIRSIFIERIQEDTGKRTFMPAPAWFTAK